MRGGRGVREACKNCAISLEINTSSWRRAYPAFSLGTHSLNFLLVYTDQIGEDKDLEVVWKPWKWRNKLHAAGIVISKSYGKRGNGETNYMLQHMRCASFVVKKPMVIGHECAGIIEDVGSEVKHLEVGDRVALEPGISCRKCDLCKEGRYNLCREMKFFGSPPTNGSLANKVVHPANLCYKLPDNVSLEEGAMCEPLSVGIHACRRVNIGPETNVLIMGAGPIGLITLLAARAFGAPRIFRFQLFFLLLLLFMRGYRF